MNVPSGNGTSLQGVLKDVFEALSYSLRYRFGIEFQSDNVFGNPLPDGTYNGMLGALARKEVDIAGPFSASEQRASVADFTNCLEFSRLGIITGIKSADRNLFIYFKVFTWQVWISLLITVIVCALVSFFIFHVMNKKKNKVNNGYLLRTYFWIFSSYIIGHDAGPLNHWTLRDMWRRYAFRLLLAAWLLGPVINSMYTFQGSITGTFAVNRLRPVISDLNELATKKKVVPVITKGSAVEICFRASLEHAHLWKRMQNHSIVFSASTVEETLINVEKGTHVLIVDFIYALSIVSDWVKRTGRCSIQVEELPFCQNFISLALRKNFDPLKKKKIDAQLTYILQAKLTDRWLNRVLNNYTHCSRRPPEGSKPLSLSDVMGGLVIWGAGTTISVLSLVAEVVTAKLRRKSKKTAKNKRKSRTVLTEDLLLVQASLKGEE